MRSATCGGGGGALAGGGAGCGCAVQEAGCSPTLKSRYGATSKLLLTILILSFLMTPVSYVVVQVVCMYGRSFGYILCGEQIRLMLGIELNLNDIL